MSRSRSTAVEGSAQNVARSKTSRCSGLLRILETAVSFFLSRVDMKFVVVLREKLEVARSKSLLPNLPTTHDVGQLNKRNCSVLTRLSLSEKHRTEIHSSFPDIRRATSSKRPREQQDRFKGYMHGARYPYWVKHIWRVSSLGVCAALASAFSSEALSKSD